MLGDKVEPCEHCQGTGVNRADNETCTICSGTGRQPQAPERTRAELMQSLVRKSILGTARLTDDPAEGSDAVPSAGGALAFTPLTSDPGDYFDNRPPARNTPVLAPFIQPQPTAPDPQQPGTVCFLCNGTGEGASGGFLSGGKRWRRRCTECGGLGRILSEAEREEAAEAERLKMERLQAEAAERAREADARRAAQEAAEAELMRPLLEEPPARWMIGRLTGKRETRFEIGKLAEMEDLNRREALIERGLERTTNDLLKAHLSELKTQMSKKKRHRRMAVEQLEKLDARAVPMLFRMCFMEPDTGKAGGAAYKAMQRIPDPRALSYYACSLRNWSHRISIAHLIRSVDDIAGGFDTLSITDQIRCFVAWGDRDALMEHRQDTLRVLLSDLASEKENVREFGLFSLMGLGDESMISKMSHVLNSQEDKDLAVAFLNCGHPRLIAAAEDWANARGYEIEKTGGSRPVRWGSF